MNGKASSGWQSGSSWQVPLGVLEEGQQYSWSVSVRENATQAMVSASSVLRVDRRMGSGGPAPSDSLGGASVNLANGNLYVSASGHGVSSVGGSLAVGLTYNSQLAVTNGLVGTYYQEADRNWVIESTESPSLVRVDSSFDMAWSSGAGVAAAPPGMPADQFMARWTGYLTVPADGAYQFGVRSDDGVRITVGGTQVYSDWTAHGVQTDFAWSGSPVSLMANQPVKIQIEYYNYLGPGVLQIAAKSDTLAQRLLPSAWLTPGLASLPAGWAVSLPGGGNSYTKAALGYQSVLLTDSTGAGHTYLQTSTGGYTPPVGESGVLSGSAAAGWTLNDDDGSVYTFNPQGQPTSARSATDAVHPAAATYGYDTNVTPARITTIHDPVSGRDITLSYGGSQDCPATVSPGVWAAAPANLLCKVTYWDGTATVLHYGNGQLVAVEEPGDAVTQFGYGEGLLTEVRGVLANDLIRNTKLADIAATKTQISYDWVQPASAADQATNIRPAFAKASKAPTGEYPAGSIPLVTKVTGPAPDGALADRPEHSYDYTVNLSTTKVTVKGITATASTVTYDPTGRTLTTRTASNPEARSTWDAAGKDLPVTSTDPAGRMSTTVYDWADRVTDTFGPAPAACFDTTTGKPVSYTGDCANIPHSHTGYDTDMTGTRTAGLSLDQFDNPDLTGQPSGRTTTTSLEPSQWPKTATQTSARLTGEIALSPGTYTFSADLADKVDDGIRIYVGDTLVVDRWLTLSQAIQADIPDKYWTLGTTTPVKGSLSATPLAPAAFTGTPVAASPSQPVDPTPSANFPGTGALDIGGAFDNMANSPTVELWFKTGAAGVLIGQEDATDSSYAPIMYIGTDGRLRGSFWNTAGSLPIATTGTVWDNTWHHVLLSTSQAVNGLPSFQSLYLDGALVGTKADAPTYDFMHRVYMGAGITTGWPAGTTGAVSWTGFSGQLAQAAIYNHPLDQTAAARHYQAGLATLTGTTPVTFAAATPVVTGTLPAAPVSTPQRVRVEYRNVHTGTTTAPWLTVQSKTGGVTTPLAMTAFSTRYGLPTWQTTDDKYEDVDKKLTTATKYDGSGLDLQFGLATSTVADPGGIAVTTSTKYEAPSATTYLRPQASALSSGTLSDPLKSTTTTYYGDTETRANPCVSGSPMVNQAGMAKLSTKPAAKDGSQISEESVYDAAGRVIAARYVSDTKWTCTIYDVRGRAATVTTPAWGSDTTARTVTTTYAVGDDARVSTVTDGTSTVSSTVDLLGRTHTYTDTSGVTTITEYNVAGRTTSVASTAAGRASTLGYAYRDDGQVDTVTLDGTPVVTVAYDTTTGEVTGVTYPFGSLGSLVKYPSGALKGDTWTITQTSTNRTFTEQVTRSQSGRVMGSQWDDSSTAANKLAWRYSYDAVGRLTQAALDPAGSRSQVTFGYSFAKTGGCGADTAAGENGSRTGSTVQIGAVTAAASAYCYDYASRLTEVTGANAIASTAITYDTHGNATRIGDQTWTYDAADRVSGTTAVSTNETLVYTRDMTGRVVARVATGPEAGTTRYGFTSGDDSPDFQLTAAKAISERYVSLPGGVLVTKPYNQPTTPSSWSIPNWHGDVTAQASISSAGVITVTGGNWVSDPYGQPLSPTTGAVDLTATPTTRTGTGSTDSWLGKNQRGYEHTGALNQMLMGARTYLPSLGLFTSTDPVSGGNVTDYAYPDDPVNFADLTGEFLWALLLPALAVPGLGEVLAVALVVVLVVVVVSYVFYVASRPSTQELVSDCFRRTRSTISRASANVTIAIASAGIAFAKASRPSKKERSTEKPTWSTTPPKPGQSGKDYATQEMNKRYGTGGWNKSGKQGQEYGQLSKYHRK